MFQKIAVCGLGLLGGSLCRGVRQYHPRTRIDACERVSSRVRPALDHGVVDNVVSIEAVCSGDYDLVVVATPVLASIEIIAGFLDTESPESGPLVIDVGSVKAEVVRTLEKLPGAARFIGCHPMVGSEKTGYENSIADIYKGASVIITPHSRNPQEATSSIVAFWESLGAETVIASPEFHDLCVAYTSHLPKLIATLLAGVLMNFTDPGVDTSGILPFIGTGFRDTTRIASGSPEMWRDILLTNRDSILKSLGAFKGEMKKLTDMLEKCEKDPGRVQQYFEEINKYREGI